MNNGEIIRMNKCVFLDRDGTINVEKNYLYKIEDFVFLPRVIDALRLLQDAGYLLVIITNQSGIARGYYTEEDFNVLNSWMLNKLKACGIELSAVYYCPHHPAARYERYRVDCNCRKPKLGMYEQAVKDLNIDLSHSYTIGDKIRDCAICSTSLCRGFLIGESENVETIEAVKSEKYIRVRYADDLYDAATIILSDGVEASMKEIV